MSHWDHEISIWGPLNFPFNSCSSSPNGPFNPFNPRSAKPRTRAPLPAEVLGNLELLGPSRSSGPWRQPRAIPLRPPTEKPSWVWREALEGSRGQRQSPLHPLSHAEELLRGKEAPQQPHSDTASASALALPLPPQTWGPASAPGAALTTALSQLQTPSGNNPSLMRAREIRRESLISPVHARFS